MRSTMSQRCLSYKLLCSHPTCECTLPTMQDILSWHMDVNQAHGFMDVNRSHGIMDVNQAHGFMDVNQSHGFIYECQPITWDYGF
ncbi:hypothetical protein EB796_025258 [Bugula neritina]|uniref:Uncharacterized protein n=1 Tax=Bugula neritina TaxID=10212 RepID=A0A7J7ISR3_BUGNE|nr:hypothetical protein EB796_025258 [Bugula neritina]